MTLIKAVRARLTDTGCMDSAPSIFPSRLGALPTAGRPAASVFLPKEHGSWSLALEPLALGLLVAPSVAGGSLALVAFVGFLARRPLKQILPAGGSARSGPARRALTLFIALGIVGLSVTLLTADWQRLWPLLLVIPPAACFAWFDAQGESRAAAAELVGSAAFAGLPTALATLAGWSRPAALALGMIALARTLPTVLTVRTYVRQAKQQGARSTAPLLAAALVTTILCALRSANLIPLTSVIAASVLLVRSVWLLGSHRPTWSASRVGRMEAILGLLYVTTIAAAYHGE